MMGITAAAVESMQAENPLIAQVTPRAKKCGSCYSQGTCLTCRAGQQFRDERLTLRLALAECLASIEYHLRDMVFHNVECEAERLRGLLTKARGMLQ